MKRNLRFCLIGRGSIGRRHLRNLEALSFKDIVAYSEAHDRNKDRRFKMEYGVETVSSIKKLREFRPDAVIIANPTSKHMEASRIALDLGAHIFMEKPVSHNLRGLDGLKKRIAKGNLVFFSANNLRFHPVLVHMKELVDRGAFGDIYFTRIQAGQYLPDWHPYEDYRTGYAARKNLGGGVVLTLQHEIDYAYWLFGKFKNIRSCVKKVSNLEIDVEDIASVIIETEKGLPVEIHLDYLQRPPKRTIQVQGSKGSIDYSFGDRYLRFYDFRRRRYKNILDFKKYDNNCMYQDEMKHFIRCIRGLDNPKIGLEDAVYVLEACLKIKKEGI